MSERGIFLGCRITAQDDRAPSKFGEVLRELRRSLSTDRRFATIERSAFVRQYQHGTADGHTPYRHRHMVIDLANSGFAATASFAYPYRYGANGDGREPNISSQRPKQSSRQIANENGALPAMTFARVLSASLTSIKSAAA